MDRIKLLTKAKNMAILEKRYIEAIEVIDNILTHSPNDIDSLRLKGNVFDLIGAYHLEMNDMVQSEFFFNSAKECYERIIDIDSEVSLAYIDLGDYWVHFGNNNKAMHHYDKAIDLLAHGKSYLSLKDECVEVYSRKVDLLMETGNNDEALRCIKEGLKLCPDSKELLDIKNNITRQ